MSTVLPLLPDDPERLGGYTLLGRLGSGGMGTVFLARSTGGRLAAVKTVRADLRERPDHRERLLLEAEAARVLGAEHTAAFLGADPEGSPPWLAISYLIGPSLTEAMAAGGPLPEAAVRRLGSALAGALAALHRAGLVHRDLKPSNVLITARGPLLIDFGLAQAPGSPRLTAPGGVTGTPGYMSPEQARGARPDARGDVFALGGVLVYASTGHGPYEARGRHDTLRLLRDGAAPDLAGVPEGLRASVAACLAAEPDGRPSPEALRDAWGPFEAGEFADLLPPGIVADLSRRVGDIAALGSAPLRAPAAEPAPSRRGLLAGAAAVAVTGAGLGALWWSGALSGSGGGARAGGPSGTPRPSGSARRPAGTAPAPSWSVAAPFSATPTMVSDEVLVHHGQVLRGMSTSDGATLWEASTTRVGMVPVGGRLAGLFVDADDNPGAGYVDPRTGRLGADAVGPSVLGDLDFTSMVLAADETCLYLRAFYRSEDDGRQPWLTAYDLTTRQVRWRQRMEGAVWGPDRSLIMSAIVGEGRLVGSDPGRIFAVDTRDGRLLWSCRLRTDEQAVAADGSGGMRPPVLSDAHAFDVDDTITAVDLATGAVAWRLEPEGDRLLSPPVWVNGVVHVADGVLNSFDARTGRRVWKHDPGAYVRQIASAAPFRGELYVAVGGDGQAVVAVDPDARRTVWTLSAGAVGMSDGVELLARRGDRLYAQTTDRVAAIPLA
ncbi:PQQ-binding-like beta-propeller repeat protein [Streptomyces sp. NPDC048606]|uniref:serine/threonine-protein kinase n=1 Tax=Streptomyces sp. NPDC048606 TaxID=3154726 RepID=UPI00342C5848